MASKKIYSDNGKNKKKHSLCDKVFRSDNPIQTCADVFIRLWMQKMGSFYMIEKASEKRFEGWPLDSLSINKENGKHFVDGSSGESKENIIKDPHYSVFGITLTCFFIMSGCIVMW